MKRALYLRPKGLDLTGLDAAVKAWLATEGIEPVDEGESDLIVCLPYCGGGCYYHRDVSVEIAGRIVQHLASGGELRWINLRSCDTEWVGLTDGMNGHEALVSANLEFEDNGYGGKPTLAIMSPDEVTEAHRILIEEYQLSYHELGVVWQPRPPRKPVRPYYSDQEITFMLGRSRS